MSTTVAIPRPPRRALPPLMTLTDAAADRLRALYAKGKQGKQAKGVQVTSARLLGVWVPAKSPPAGTSVNIEFTRDGKLKYYGKTKVQGKDTDFKTEATYKIVEEIIKVKDGKETLEYYEAQLVTDTKIEYEAEVGADGKFMKETKKEAPKTTPAKAVEKKN